MCLAIDLYKNVSDAPAPVPKALHLADTLTFNIDYKQRTEAVPTMPNCFVAMSFARSDSRSRYFSGCAQSGNSSS